MTKIPSAATDDYHFGRLYDPELDPRDVTRHSWAGSPACWCRVFGVTKRGDLEVVFLHQQYGLLKETVKLKGIQVEESQFNDYCDYFYNNFVNLESPASRPLTIRFGTKDRWGVSLAELFDSGGICLNRELVNKRIVSRRVPPRAGGPPKELNLRNMFAKETTAATEDVDA